MPVATILILSGILLRQIDRLRHRPGSVALTAAQAMSLQRERATVWVPALLLLGEWIQIAGWWRLAGVGLLPAAVAVVAVGVQFRHLQEISHFAVHGVLARGRRANAVLAEVFAHLPMALGPVAVRRIRHVRDHHPNATVSGADPNLAELHAAGLVPAASRWTVTRAVLFPLTPRGTAVAAAAIGRALHRPAGAAAGVAVAFSAFSVGGWFGVLFGLVVPRLWVYPQLAWLSLLGEHTWFDPQRREGARAEVEAGRCLRLYPQRPLMAAAASMMWLPYGDLHHYAHSAHPAVRWNYLPAVERHLAPPHCTPPALLIGPRSLLARHRRALTGTSPGGGAVAPGAESRTCSCLRAETR
ncbi:fatty acid desaturase [Streptomyces sp. NPDC050085]|uniref:fatty acid desaturase n=1 Tax=Streptomyces sp. NPDC050085 TaxID=3365600 RepID=UPI0037AFBFDB